MRLGLSTVVSRVLVAPLRQHAPWPTQTRRRSVQPRTASCTAINPKERATEDRANHQARRLRRPRAPPAAARTTRLAREHGRHLVHSAARPRVTLWAAIAIISAIAGVHLFATGSTATTVRIVGLIALLSMALTVASTLSVCRFKVRRHIATLLIVKKLDDDTITELFDECELLDELAEVVAELAAKRHSSSAMQKELGELFAVPKMRMAVHDAARQLRTRPS